ncbi:MAG: UDP-2,3-diacylglucosamine diphosphatase [Bacteroidales bacterium]|nr:UDP-2,3-diacylglucosamine diphosphatase [Bacteroidales bacterium]
MQLVPAQYYFLADVHLGAKLPGEESVKNTFLDFLRSIPGCAKTIYLLGDIFDFWAELQGEHPKGFENILSALKDLTASGVRIVFFKGNHDYWTFGYLKNEIGMEIVEDQPVIENIAGKKFCIAHGDGLGKCGLGYWIIRFFFRNKLCIKLLGTLPAEPVFRFGNGWSKSRKERYHSKGDYNYAKENDRLSAYSEEFFKTNPVDYFVYGHIHQVIDKTLACKARMIVVGDWYKNPCYISFNEGEEPALNRIEAI